MLKQFIFFIFILIQNPLMAQANMDNLSVKINLKFNQKPIVIGEEIISTNADTLSLEMVKFYFSSFEINYKDNTIFKEKNSYHLIDSNNPESLVLKLGTKNNKEIKSIQFNVGIDSTASVSGALDGDLDPINAMYWAWQSGFINLKIEGKSSSCKTRNNKFEFHIGGYLQPYYAMRTVKLDVEKNATDTLTINFNLEKLFTEIKLNETNSIMIPGEKAMKIADIIQTTFSIE